MYKFAYKYNFLQLNTSIYCNNKYMIPSWNTQLSKQCKFCKYHRKYDNFPLKLRSTTLYSLTNNLDYCIISTHNNFFKDIRCKFQYRCKSNTNIYSYWLLQNIVYNCTTNNISFLSWLLYYNTNYKFHKHLASNNLKSLDNIFTS